MRMRLAWVSVVVLVGLVALGARSLPQPREAPAVDRS